MRLLNDLSSVSKLRFRTVGKQASAKSIWDHLRPKRDEAQSVRSYSFQFCRIVTQCRREVLLYRSLRMASIVVRRLIIISLRMRLHVQPHAGSDSISHHFLGIHRRVWRHHSPDIATYQVAVLSLRFNLHFFSPAMPQYRAELLRP